MAQSCYRQVEGLRRLGLQVDVIAYTGTDVRPTVRSEPRDHGWDHHLSRAARPGLTAQQAWRVTALNGSRPRYAHVVGFGAGRAGFTAVTFAAWLNCPSLVLVRGNDFDQDWFDPARGFWIKHALTRATLVGAVAPDLIQRIQALFPNVSPIFIPNGINLSDWALLPQDEQLRDETRAQLAPNGRRVVGFFGELKYKKGVPFFLGALRDAGLTDQVAALVVGKRMDEDTEQVLDDPALSPPNLRLPFSGREKLPGLYAACDYVALPSFFEGMPNVLLEAMGLGVVPIVSDAGAMAEVVQDGETGFVFATGDREGAADAASRALAQTPEEREAMGRRARECVTDKYSLDIEIAALAEILKP
jgi:glycogen(starch) synthase